MKQKDKIKTWAEINSNGNSTDRMNAFLNSRDDASGRLSWPQHVRQ